MNSSQYVCKTINKDFFKWGAKMKINQFRLSLKWITILLLITITLSFQQQRQIKNIPDKPDKIDQKLQIDLQLVQQVSNQVDETAKTPRIFEPLANLQDIYQANSDNFFLKHKVIDGVEWIRGELENYLVLKYKNPMISSVDVSGIQKVLQELDYYFGPVDGIYGPITEAAVVEFQKKHGLLPTGIMDLDDYHLLASIYDQKVVSVSKKVKPKGQVQILIVLDERRLYVLEDGQVFDKFPIAIGKLTTPSPLGNWRIISKDSWGGGFGTHWLGLNVPYGRFGIHGTNKPWSIGGAESHGCFRMYNRDVETLYKWVTWGTRVYVVGGDFPYNLPWRKLREGDKGSDVWQLQNRLKELGYYKYSPDSIFGRRTKQAVMNFQKDHGLVSNGVADWNTRYKLGFYLFQ